MADTDYRVERDSMGETRVPAGALWGAQTQRAIQNFPISGVRGSGTGGRSSGASAVDIGGDHPLAWLDQTSRIMDGEPVNGQPQGLFITAGGGVE